METNQNYSRELEGKIALVTGATKGIGKAIADKLSEAGAKVIVAARSIPRDANPNHHYITADLSTSENVAKAVDEINKNFPRVDILVNNLGGNTSPGGGFNVLTDEHWNYELQLNLLSAVRLDKAILPKMIEQKGGVIIHISSTSGLMPIWEATMAYSTAKAALNAYSKTLSNEVASQGVRVITVSPGSNKTQSMTSFIEDLAKNAGVTADQMTKNLMTRIGGIPMGRMADPDETADLVHFLVSPRAAYITGVNYIIDGGNLPVV